MKFLIRNVTVFLLVFTIVSLPFIAFAQSDGKIINPLGQSGPQTVPAFIELLLKRVIQIAFPVIALAIIYCGFLFVSAQGNPAELEKAKSSLLYTLIGAAILLGAWALAQLITSTVTSLGN